MTVALYATVWLSLVALLLSEAGRQQQRRALELRSWARIWSAAGVTLGVVHGLLAIGNVYHWDHAHAVAVTAARSTAAFGVGWSGSLYVNYVFLAWWAMDTVWWFVSPGSFIQRPAWVEWLWRLAALVMVINSAIVFASPAGRLAGVVLTAGLLWAWNRRL